MSISEASVQAAIRLEAARLGHGLWRNNSGAARDVTGRLIRYGLGNDSAKINAVWKSPDLIGIQAGTGRLIGVECKASNWTGPTPGDTRALAQLNCLRDFRALGAYADFATSVEDFYRILAGEVRWV